jgi:DNA-binding transcriptional LysR family regulator
VVASPEYAHRLPATLSLSDLALQPMIAYIKGARFRNTTDQLLEEVGVSPNVAMEFDTHDAIKAMVRLGFGVALEPASAVAHDLAEGHLVRLVVPELKYSSRTTSLILRRDERRSPVVETFITMLGKRYQIRA